VSKLKQLRKRLSKLLNLKKYHFIFCNSFYKHALKEVCNKVHFNKGAEMADKTSK
jgi:hypothetical protein